MNLTHRHSGPSTSAGRRPYWALALALVLGLGLAFPAGSLARASGGGGGGGAGVNRGGDDETIGTLPILGNQGQLLLVRNLRATRPDFYLEGNYGEILATIAGFRGTGLVTSESLPGGMVRLGFHGQLELTLDRGMLQVTGIQIGSSVPEEFGGAQAWAGFPDETDGAHVLEVGALPLPVAALDALGVLNQTSWHFASLSPAGEGYRFSAVAVDGLLNIGQIY
jgi:hypothetical protein